MTRAAVARIGLLGGTFDPVHKTHLAAAQLFLDALALDEVRFLVAGKPWQKPLVGASAAQRLEMLQIALAPHAPRFVADTRELARSGASYSVDSLGELREQFGHDAILVFLIGSDQLARLQTWSRWREIFELANLGIVVRSGFDLAALAVDAEVARQIRQRRIDPELLPAGLCQPAGQVAMIAADLPDTASTRIREAAQAGDLDSIADLVPSGISDYIRSHLLYRT